MNRQIPADLEIEWRLRDYLTVFLGTLAGASIAVTLLVLAIQRLFAI